MWWDGIKKQSRERLVPNTFVHVHVQETIECKRFSQLQACQAVHLAEGALHCIRSDTYLAEDGGEQMKRRRRRQQRQQQQQQQQQHKQKHTHPLAAQD